MCTHLDAIQVTSLPESVPGCVDCLRIALEPREDWSWCYEDEIAFRFDLAGA